jgi:hypothetical protein
MAVLCFDQELSMDKNQVIELWRSLSPRLTRAIFNHELREKKHLNRKKTDGVDQDQMGDSIEDRPEESDV